MLSIPVEDDAGRIEVEGVFALRWIGKGGEGLLDDLSVVYRVSGGASVTRFA